MLSSACLPVFNRVSYHSVISLEPVGFFGGWLVVFMSMSLTTFLTLANFAIVFFRSFGESLFDAISL